MTLVLIEDFLVVMQCKQQRLDFNSLKLGFVFIDTD